MSVASVPIGTQVKAGRRISFAAQRTSVLVWAEIALISGVVLAVLAFGGTEPGLFSGVEILYGAMAIAILGGARTESPIQSKLILVPALLVGVALLQLFRLPISWARAFGRGVTGGEGAHAATL